MKNDNIKVIVATFKCFSQKAVNVRACAWYFCRSLNNYGFVNYIYDHI